VRASARTPLGQSWPASSNKIKEAHEGRARSMAIKVGIVGFGGMGQGHARNVSGIEGMTLVAVADPKPEARKAAKDCGAVAFASHRRMMDRARPEAVIVSSPSNTHGRVVRDCCSRGTHVFCEKPLTTRFSEAIKVRDAVKASRIVFSIGLVLRHSDIYRRAKELVERGEIGEVGMADCRYCGHMLGRYEYVFSRTLGRGLINEHTIHMIDVMEYILGPVISVYAQSDASDEHTEYNAAVLMKHESGAFTTVSGSGISRLPVYARITGLKAELLIEGNQRLLFKDSSGERQVLAADLGYRRELEDFRDAIIKGVPPHTGIDAAFCCARLIEAIYRSAELGRVVKLRTLPD